jgi:tetratricopeptide (TPR) repeat protein
VNQRAQLSTESRGIPLNVINVNLRAGWEREQLGDLAGAQACYSVWTATGLDTGEGWFRLGIVCLKQGIYQTAQEGFQSSLQLEFKPAESLNLLGVAQAELGHTAEAEASFRAAIELAPQFADAYTNLGRVLLKQGKHSEAEVEFQRGLQINPRGIAGWEGLAGLHMQTDRPEAAMQALHSLLKLHPQHVDAIVLLSELMTRQGSIAEAERGFQIALGLAPQRVDAYVGLGVVLTEKKQLHAACEQFEQAIRLAPNSVAAYSNLGNAQRELGDFSAAAKSLERAISIAPKHASVLANLGSLCLDRHQYLQAQHYFQQALEHEPSYPHAQIGMASIFSIEGKTQTALEILREVVQRKPQLVQAQFNLAVLELRLGNWRSGFERYEWRWRLPYFPIRDYPQPVWDGAPVRDKTLLLYSEQGMGDTLQFCRYAAAAKQRVGCVLLEAPRALHDLLHRTQGIDAMVESDKGFRDFDYHLPLMSLPRVFQTTPETVPASVPYLTADPARQVLWQVKFPATEDFRIGVVWRGNPKYRGDQERSVALDRFAPLAKMDKVRLFALQKEQVDEEIARMAEKFAVVDLAAELDNDGSAFVDSAAVMQQLDLVITVDSAPAHLAGALGVPVWLLLAYNADWRWLESREDSPWYPTMRLFRQPAPGNWVTVFERLACELAQLLNRRP